MKISESHLRSLIRNLYLSENLNVSFGSAKRKLRNYGDAASDDESSTFKSETSHTGPASKFKLDDVEILKKSAANIDDLSDNSKKLLKYLYKKAAEMEIETPVVTSGMRGPKSQATVMWNNWNNQGGKSGGNEYLLGLYKNNSMAKKIGAIFTNAKDKASAVKGAIKILEIQPISNHATGDAFDLRLTKDIYKVLSEIEKEGYIKLVDETKKAGPHWHVKVLKAPDESV